MENEIVNVMLFNPENGLFRIMNVLFQKPRTSTKSRQVSRIFQYRFVNRGRPMRYLWDTFCAVSICDQTQKSTIATSQVTVFKLNVIASGGW